MGVTGATDPTLPSISDDTVRMNKIHSFRVWFHIFYTRFECSYSRLVLPSSLVQVVIIITSVATVTAVSSDTPIMSSTSTSRGVKITKMEI